MKQWTWAPAVLISIFTLVGPARAQGLSARLQKVCAAKRTEYGARFIDCKEGYDFGVTPPSASYQASAVGPMTASREAVNFYWYGGKDVYTNPFPYIKKMRSYLNDKFNFGTYDPAADQKLKADADAADKDTDECRALIRKPNPWKELSTDGGSPKEKVLPAAGSIRQEKGMPLAGRFRDLIDNRFNDGRAQERSVVCDPSDAGYNRARCEALQKIENAPLLNWLDKVWIPSQGAGKARAADGSCYLWSAWAMDRKVIDSLKGLESGLMCDGIPLTLGEIKEIYYQLYGAAGGGRNPLRETSVAFFSGTEKQEHLFEGSMVKKTMDANLGLARLGALGEGVDIGGGRREGIDPDTVLEKFRAAMESTPPKSFTFDRDHGAEMWNQPVYAMVVTRYVGDSNAMDVLSTTDFEPVGGDAGLSDLQTLEKSLIVKLQAGQGLDPADRQKLEDIAKKTIPADAPLAEQANLVSDAKRKLLDQGRIQPKGGSRSLHVIQQDLTVLYGEENTFGSMGPDRQAQRSYKFATVVDANGHKVKSTWTPSQGKLSDFCQNPSPEFTGFSAWSAPYECCKLARTRLADAAHKKLSPAERVDDYPLLTSAPPPRHIDLFDELDPDLDDPGAEAYHQFRIMLMGEAAFSDPVKRAEAARKWGPLKSACPSFDRAARFMNLFRECRDQKGAVSADDRLKLLGYLDQAQFLDQKWVDKFFCNAADFPGLAELKAAVKLRNSEFCK